MRNMIARERKNVGLTQADLAERLGCHWITISKLERGKMKLTMDWVGEIARALSVSQTKILGMAEEESPTPETFSEGAGI